MKYDWHATNTENFVDQKNKMMNAQNQDWNPNGDFGRGDAIGRNFIAYFLYNNLKFVEGVKDCWVRVADGKTYYNKGYRYPTHNRKDLSRDHVLNTLLIYKLHNLRNKKNQIDLKEFVKHLKWKISEKFNFSVDLWFFARSIAGFKWAIPFFYLISFIVIGLAVIWNNYIFKIGNFYEETSQEEYIKDKSLTDLQKFCRKLIYPTYTILQLAWQLYFLSDSWAKRKLQKLVSKIVPKHNYVMQLLFQTKQQPTKKQVYSYKSMRGGRWTTTLNNMTDRDLNIIEEKWPYSAKTLLRANVMDVDLVRMLFEKMNYKS